MEILYASVKNKCSSLFEEIVYDETQKYFPTKIVVISSADNHMVNQKL